MSDIHLKSLLKGVEAERGAIVTCRDPSALEMLLRIGNSDANKGSISVMLQKRSAAGNLHEGLGVAQGQLLFVNDRYSRSLEDEVQSWLDPFKTTTSIASPTSASNNRKRVRSSSESDESSLESDSDYD
jgi:hypothetical protein